MYETAPLGSGGQSIADYAAPASAPTSWSGTGFGYTVTGTYAASGFAGGKYAHFGTVGSPDTIASHSGPVSASPLSEMVTVAFKVVVPSNQVAHQYTATIVFSATAIY